MTDVEALARYVHQLHHHMGLMFVRELGDQTDAWYRPTPGGLLERYLEMVDELGRRFGAAEDRDEFYPPGQKRCERCGCVAAPGKRFCFVCYRSAEST